MQQEVQGGKYMAEVEAQVQWAYRIGVSGVPTYVINDRYAVTTLEGMRSSGAPVITPVTGSKVYLPLVLKNF